MKLVRFVLLGLVITAARQPAEAAAPAATPFRHDLYVTTTLGGQGGVMGGRTSGASGVYVSADRQNFTHVGHTHIRMFKVVPDLLQPGALLLTGLDGVMRSSDRGATWHRLTGWEMTEPKGIAVDPHAPERIYVGLPDGIGVSADHGRTWRRMNDGIRRAYTQSVVVDRSRRDRVLAGTELGIYLSEDGARSWRLVQPTRQVTYEIRQSPHAADVFFAVTSLDGAWWSQDAGVTWQRVAGVPVEHTLHTCDFDPADARRLVLCGWGAGVMVSEDGGRTWLDRTAGLPNREIWSVSSDPDLPGRLYAAPYLEAVHVSDDFGRTWRPLAFEKAVVYNFMFVPRS